MRYLLDTNILLYLFAAPDELSQMARRVLEMEHVLFVSRASLWEIGIKQSIGKLKLEDPFDRILVAQAQEGDFAIDTSDRLIPQYPVQTVW